ncbi:hypothetical protein [Salipiger sp.]|uniref:hypothetical protein n=1 Tax=Salipiger sp. TaxID=2078585 RepID=UPI003A97070C
MNEPMGMLMAMMQPPADMEEEFQDWYDTEHIPERAAITGFLSAQRFVCLDGFPKYIAAYDLTHHGVLQEPEYQAVAGTNFSPWSKRILPRVHGQRRLEGPQIYPGSARYGDSGKPARCAIVRLRGMEPDSEASIVEGLRACFESRDDVLQIRIWRSNYHGDNSIICMVEGDISLDLKSFDYSPLGALRHHVDLANLYVEYWRRGVLTGVFK